MSIGLDNTRYQAFRKTVNAAKDAEQFYLPLEHTPRSGRNCVTTASRMAQIKSMSIMDVNESAVGDSS